MYKLNTRKYPLYSDDNTHIVAENKFFYEYNKQIPAERLNINNMSVISSKEINVLDYGLGLDGLWCRIKFNEYDEQQNLKTFVGYVRSSAITPIANKNIKPFFEFSTNNSLAANPRAVPITWYTQEPKTIFDDELNGTIAVNWIFEDVTQFTQNNASSELDIYLRQAYEDGIRYILENEGYDIENNLQEFYKFLYNYYSIGRAEEWYVDPRPCSPLNVLVAIPKRILYSNNIKIPKKLALRPKGFAGDGEILQEGQPLENNKEYVKVTFDSVDEYYNFTSILINKLKYYNLVINNTEWIFEPSKFYPIKEITDVKNYYSEVFGLVTLNISYTDKNASDVRAMYEEIRSTAFENLKSFEKFFTKDFADQLIKNKRWNGKITFVINKTDLTLTNIEYRIDDKEYLLSIGLTNFLRKQIVQNPTIINYILNRDLILLDKDIELQKFLNEIHNPSINATELPLDIARCLTNAAEFARDIANSKTPQAIELYNKIRERDTEERTEKEGDGFTIATLNLQNVIDPNIRILFGLEPIPGDTSKEKFFNYVSVVNSLDWAKYMAFAAACQVRFVDENTLQELLKNYKEARKVIEKILLSTVCNPYVTNGIKVINSLSIPQINTNNSLEALSKAISEAIIELLLEVLQTGLKEILKAILNSCMSNPQSDFGGASGNDLNNNLGDALNDPDLSDLLDDAIGDLNDENGLPDNNARDKAKQDLQNLANDLAACLSTSEFCRLLNGYSVNDEVYHLIVALVQRKYGTTLSKKFNSIEYIKYFFRALGSKMNIEEICKDNLEDERPRDSNLLCDTGKLQQLRKQLLSDKGIPPELIDQQLEDLKNKEKENLDKALKILNSDNPLDFSEAPDLLCKVFPNGETIAPPRDSLNKTVDSIYDPIFTLFNEEAQDWYQTTYSIRSSAPQMLEFDKNSGQIKVKTISSYDNKSKIDNSYSSEESKRLEAASPSNAAAAAGGNYKLPSYMFKNIFSNRSKYKLLYPPNSSLFFSTSLSGHEQMSLDTNIISDDLRKQTEKAEILLRKAVKDVLFLLHSKLHYETTKAIGAFASSLNIDDSLNTPEKIGAIVKALFKGFSQFINIISVLDMYYSNNIDNFNSDIEEERKKLLYSVFGISNSQQAAAIFASEKGIPIYYLICENFYELNGKPKNSLLNLIAYLSDKNSQQYFIDNQEVYKTAVSSIEAAGLEYVKVKNFYKTVTSTKVLYPDYEINYFSGMPKLSITNLTQSNLNGQKINIGNAEEKSFQFNTYFNEKLHDLYSLEIKKNGNNHINIKDVIPVSDTIKNYIVNDLKVNNLNNVNKQNLYKKFIEHHLKRKNIQQNLLSSQTTYDVAVKSIFTSMTDKCINNKFLLMNKIVAPDKSTPSTPPRMEQVKEGPDGEPYTKKLALVLPVTIKQAICNVKPHYLDLDSIKNTVKNELQNSNCIKAIIDEKIAQKKPVTPQEIDALETNDFQKSSLKGIHQLSIRLYLHDIILRSIAVFGYYDPQSLRDEKLYINFLSDLVEVEMRGMDNNYFRLLSNYLLEMYLKKNPLKEGEKLTEFKKNKFRRLALRSAVEGELKNQVLAKLSKRIDIDTNQKILAAASAIPNSNESTIKLVNIYDDIKNFDFLKIDQLNKSISIKYVTIKGQTSYIEIYTNANSNNIWADFTSRPEYEFLFKYIFPVTQYLSIVSITAIMSCATRRQVVDAFRDTKKKLIKTAKSIQTNGRKLSPDPNNPQDLENSNPNDLIWKFIIKALITTPLTVTKAFAEGSEPNLAIVTTVFKLARAFVPELPSFLIPAVSLPAIFYIPPINPILFGLYHGLLMWYDENNLKDPSLSSKDEFLKSLSGGMGSAGQAPDCSNTINNDNFYVDKAGNPLTESPISSPYNIYYGTFVKSNLINPPINVSTQQEIVSVKKDAESDGPDLNKDNMF